MEFNSISESLIAACRAGDAEAIKDLVSKEPLLLNQIDSKLR